MYARLHLAVICVLLFLLVNQYKFLNQYFLNEQSCELEEYDEQLVRRLIEKVTVFDDKLTVEFKSGVEIDIEIQDIRNGDQMRGVTSLIGGFSYLRIDFDCEYTYNNINNVVDIIINKEWTT